MKPKVAINGFGRIGRMIFRANLVRDLLDIVAINDTSSSEMQAHLLKYDSTYGTITDDVKADGPNGLLVNGKKIPMFFTRDPLELPWKKLGVDLVLECTGAFTDREGASKHLKVGAKRVLISAPGKNVDATFGPV